MIKVIKTPAEYHASMAQVSKLLARDPAPGTPEAEELETLAVLIHEYEARNFDIGSPDPIEALKFRMEQENLSQRDLVPFLGSRSKVSEVLSGRRPLTLSMMRALHAGLGIPAKVLLQESVTPNFDERQIQWDKFPLREMVRAGLDKGKRTRLSLASQRCAPGFLWTVGAFAGPPHSTGRASTFGLLGRLTSMRWRLGRPVC